MCSVLLAVAVVLAGGVFARADVPAMPPPQPVPESTADHGKFDEL